MRPPVDTIEGEGPVILCQPHAGTFLPDDVLDGMNETGRRLADADWHVDRLYDGLLAEASVVRARFHRYVIDANRAPDGASLYPGQNTTGLCPLTDFNGAPIYKSGHEPSAAEIERRRLEFHAPYHAAITEAIERSKRRHGVAIVYDCHSIRSNIPYLFEGQLPVFNIGTNDGTSCDPRLQRETAQISAAASVDEYDWVVNGRFKGGWTTRHYGAPGSGVHAIQMEIAQRAYMHEASPRVYDEAKAKRLRVWLRRILAKLDEIGRSGTLNP